MINDNKIIHTVTRRMKCEASQSCRARATKVIGMKGIEFPMCEEHFGKLLKEVYGIRASAGHAAMEKAMAEKAEEVKEEVKVEAEEIKEETKEVKEEVEEKNAIKEYYTCKYCGEKFDKSETTSGQFMAHCRKCKKEHE